MVDSFQAKKWTLFSLCLVGILITIVITVVACNIIGDMKTAPSGSSAEVAKDWETVKKAAKGVIIAIGIITILIYMLGLFGAYKENYCLTLTYAILMTLATLTTIASATRPGGSSGWGAFVVNLLITILAYVFARDLKMRNHGHHGQAYA